MHEAGKTIVIERTLTQEDFDQFAKLSGDDNPIHVDPAFAATSRFGRTVAHGLLLSTILDRLVDQLVPGGTQLSQHLKFPAATYAGEPMRFTASIESDDADTLMLRMSSARVLDGTVTCEGLTTIRRSSAVHGSES